MSQTLDMYKNKLNEIYKTPMLSYPEYTGAPVKKEQGNEQVAKKLFPESSSSPSSPSSPSRTKESIMNDKYPKNENYKKSHGGKLKKSRKLRKSHRKKSFRRTSRK